MSRLSRALAAVVVVAAAGATPSAHATGTVRLEAERATLGPTCAGQAQYTYTNAAGDTLVFLGGDGCVVTSGVAVATSLTTLRWHGGGSLTGTVCGVFVAKQLGTERQRTASTCSTGTTFATATFGAGTLQPGPVELLWDPDTSTHDAHLDWVELSGDVTRTEAEAGTPAAGSCYFESHTTYTLGTGETVVLHPGDNCAITYSAANPTWLLRIRWFGGGINGEICGTFAMYTGIYEAARTNRTCSTGGAVPDWEVASFPINVAAAGTTYHVRWNPEVAWHDAHVDWIETTAGAPGSPAATLTPATIDFGLRAVGQVSAAQTVTVASPNAAPFYVRSSAVGAWHFGMTSQTCTGRWLWQGQTCTVGARHQPEWAGDHSGTVYVDTSVGMQTVALTGAADGSAPQSDFDTHSGVTLMRGQDVVAGDTEDERAGVEQVRVVYRNVAGQLTTVSATLSCTADRRECAWTAALPSLPGTYTVTAQGRDLVGHWEDPGPSISVTVL